MARKAARERFGLENDARRLIPASTPAYPRRIRNKGTDMTTLHLCARAFLTATALSLGLPAAAEAPPAGFGFPESVLMLDGRGFVSNIGGAMAPFDEDGDGYISEIDATGAILRARAFPPEGAATLNAPKGLAALRGVLYAADIDRVVGFSLETGAQVFEARYETSAPVLLNDLAVGPDDELLVSDTLGGALLELSPASGRYRRVAGRMPGANGISVAPDEAHAVVVALGADFAGGAIYDVELGTGVATPLPRAPTGVFDGVARLADGALVVSDWVSVAEPTPGRILHLGPEGEILGTLALPGVFSGPADFGLDATGAALLVPRTLDGTVSRVALVPHR